MYKQVAKKTGLLLGCLAIAVIGIFGGYSDDAGMTIGSTANAQFYLWCIGQCVDYCVREAWCLDYYGNLQGPFIGYHAECCF